VARLRWREAYEDGLGDDDAWTAAAQAAIDASRAVKRVRWGNEVCEVLAERAGWYVVVLDNDEMHGCEVGDCTPIEDEPEAEAVKPAVDGVDGLVRLARDASRLHAGPRGKWRAGAVAIRDAVLAGQKGEPRDVMYRHDKWRVLAEHREMLALVDGDSYAWACKSECKPVRRFRHGEAVWWEPTTSGDRVECLVWGYQHNGVQITQYTECFVVPESELTPREVSDE
jgi:hypothetical protein